MSNPQQESGRQIICPGFGRTGTTTLAQALGLLGFKTEEVKGHWYLVRREGECLIFDPNLEQALKYDAYADSPVPLFYKELLELFPNARVILTTRPLDAWLSSIQALHELQRRWWERNNSKDATAFEHKALFEAYNRQAHGAPWFEPISYGKSFDRHYAGVHAFFRARKQDILEIDVTDGTGWRPICDFLDKPIPIEPFPHRNGSRKNGDA